MALETATTSNVPWFKRTPIIIGMAVGGLLLAAGIGLTIFFIATSSDIKDKESAEQYYTGVEAALKQISEADTMEKLGDAMKNSYFKKDQLDNMVKYLEGDKKTNVEKFITLHEQWPEISTAIQNKKTVNKGTFDTKFGQIVTDFKIKETVAKSVKDEVKECTQAEFDALQKPAVRELTKPAAAGASAAGGTGGGGGGASTESNADKATKFATTHSKYWSKKGGLEASDKSKFEETLNAFKALDAGVVTALELKGDNKTRFDKIVELSNDQKSIKLIGDHIGDAKTIEESQEIIDTFTKYESILTNGTQWVADHKPASSNTDVAEAKTFKDSCDLYVKGTNKFDFSDTTKSNQSKEILAKFAAVALKPNVVTALAYTVQKEKDNFALISQLAANSANIDVIEQNWNAPKKPAKVKVAVWNVFDTFKSILKDGETWLDDHPKEAAAVTSLQALVNCVTGTTCTSATNCPLDLASAKELSAYGGTKAEFETALAAVNPAFKAALIDKLYDDVRIVLKEVDANNGVKAKVTALATGNLLANDAKTDYESRCMPVSSTTELVAFVSKCTAVNDCKLDKVSAEQLARLGNDKTAFKKLFTGVNDAILEKVFTEAYPVLSKAEAGTGDNTTVIALDKLVTDGLLSSAAVGHFKGKCKAVSNTAELVDFVSKCTAVNDCRLDKNSAEQLARLGNDKTAFKKLFAPTVNDAILEKVFTEAYPVLSKAEAGTGDNTTVIALDKLVTDGLLSSAVVAHFKGKCKPPVVDNFVTRDWSTTKFNINEPADRDLIRTYDATTNKIHNACATHATPLTPALLTQLKAAVEAFESINTSTPILPTAELDKISAIKTNAAFSHFVDINEIDKVINDQTAKADEKAYKDCKDAAFDKFIASAATTTTPPTTDVKKTALVNELNICINNRKASVVESEDYLQTALAATATDIDTSVQSVANLILNHAKQTFFPAIKSKLLSDAADLAAEVTTVTGRLNAVNTLIDSSTPSLNEPNVRRLFAEFELEKVTDIRDGVSGNAFKTLFQKIAKKYPTEFPHLVENLDRFEKVVDALVTKRTTFKETVPIDKPSFVNGALKTQNWANYKDVFFHLNALSALFNEPKTNIEGTDYMGITPNPDLTHVDKAYNDLVEVSKFCANAKKSHPHTRAGTPPVWKVDPTIDALFATPPDVKKKWDDFKTDLTGATGTDYSASVEAMIVSKLNAATIALSNALTDPILKGMAGLVIKAAVFCKSAADTLNTLPITAPFDSADWKLFKNDEFKDFSLFIRIFDAIKAGTGAATNLGILKKYIEDRGAIATDKEKHMFEACKHHLEFEQLSGAFRALVASDTTLPLLKTFLDVPRVSKFDAETASTTYAKANEALKNAMTPLQKRNEELEKAYPNQADRDRNILLAYGFATLTERIKAAAPGIKEKLETLNTDANVKRPYVDMVIESAEYIESEIQQLITALAGVKGSITKSIDLKTITGLPVQAHALIDKFILLINHVKSSAASDADFANKVTDANGPLSEKERLRARDELYDRVYPKP